MALFFAAAGILAIVGMVAFCDLAEDFAELRIREERIREREARTATDIVDFVD